jgi:hypothetical protein|tara:strand:- start:1330 stop:2094 length:765 start_codon:yes stop_codon:yes gene_type:complete
MDPTQAYQPQHEINVPYDVVTLPSKGIFYKNKITSVKVTYLTASDENVLTSQNLVKEGNLINELLRRKIVASDIKVEDLLDCDKEAILIFLRNTAYGSEYNLKLIDPKTQKPFDYVVDLGAISFKDFDLKPDDSGEFEFIFPVSRKKAKFKFLTPDDEKSLETLQDQYKGTQVVPSVTKRLELLIKEIDGERSPEQLAIWIQAMPIKDSQALRQYITGNKPGLDLTISTTAPSGEKVTSRVAFGAEFFRPFFGV